MGQFCRVGRDDRSGMNCIDADCEQNGEDVADHSMTARKRPRCRQPEVMKPRSHLPRVRAGRPTGYLGSPCFRSKPRGGVAGAFDIVDGEGPDEKDCGKSGSRLKLGAG